MMKADEALGSTAEERRAERRRKAVVGPLPDSFLRIPGTEVRHNIIFFIKRKYIFVVKG